MSSCFATKSFSLNNFYDVSSGIRELQCQTWIESFGDAVVRIIISISVLLKKKKKKEKENSPNPRMGCTQQSVGGRSVDTAAASLGDSHTSLGSACPHAPQPVRQAQWTVRPHRLSPGVTGLAHQPQARPALRVLATASPPRQAVPLAGIHPVPVSLSARAA